MNCLMKDGTVKEVPENEALSFLEENRDKIQVQHNPNRRPMKKDKSAMFSEINSIVDSPIEMMLEKLKEAKLIPDDDDVIECLHEKLKELIDVAVDKHLN